jgi:hypothetical protein
LLLESLFRGINGTANPLLGTSGISPESDKLWLAKGRILEWENLLTKTFAAAIIAKLISCGGVA